MDLFPNPREFIGSFPRNRLQKFFFFLFCLVCCCCCCHCSLPFWLLFATFFFFWLLLIESKILTFSFVGQQQNFFFFLEKDKQKQSAHVQYYCFFVSLKIPSCIRDVSTVSGSRAWIIGRGDWSVAGDLEVDPAVDLPCPRDPGLVELGVAVGGWTEMVRQMD